MTDELRELDRQVAEHVMGWRAEEDRTDESVHHVENLIVICQSCHAKHHALGRVPAAKGGDAHV